MQTNMRFKIFLHYLPILVVAALSVAFYFRQPNLGGGKITDQKLETNKNTILDSTLVDIVECPTLLGAKTDTSTQPIDAPGIPLVCPNPVVVRQEVKYKYISQTSLPTESQEVRELRGSNYQVFKTGKKTDDGEEMKMRVYLSDNFGGSDNSNVIQFATTSPEQFNQISPVVFFKKLFGESVYAAIVTTTLGGDTYTESANPGTNFNGDGILVTGHNTTPSDFKSPISVTMPTVGGTVTKIDLVLNRTTALGTAGSMDETLIQCNSFNEATVTYSTLPATIGSIISTTTYDKATGVKRYNIYGGTASNPLLMTGGNTYYFRFETSAYTDTNEAIYTAHESATVADRPYIEVTYTVATVARKPNVMFYNK